MTEARPKVVMPPGYLSRGLRMPTWTEFLALDALGVHECAECQEKAPDERTCEHLR